MLFMVVLLFWLDSIGVFSGFRYLSRWLFVMMCSSRVLVVGGCSVVSVLVC